MSKQIDIRHLTAYNIGGVFCRFMERKFMEFMTVKEAVTKWGLSERRL